MNIVYHSFQRKEAKSKGDIKAMAILGLLGKIGTSILGAAAGGITNKLFQNGEDERQIKQQEKLQGMQIKGAKELADYSQQKQQQNWDYTNYENQKKHLEGAGLNAGLMYGMSGGGGATMGSGGGVMPSGGNAADPNTGTQNKMNSLMQGAQLALMNAQTRKLNVEADVKGGAEKENIGQQTNESKSRQVGIDFQNAVNKAVGVNMKWENAHYENQMKGIEFEKENAMWEAFKATGFKSGNSTDENNLVNKAMKAGWETTIQALENAKTANRVQEATAAIEEFKAGLAKQGISPDSPWYVKIVGDLLDKVGLSPITKAKNVLNKM